MVYGNIETKDDRFIYYDNEYHYSRVMSIGWNWVHTKTSFNAIPTGSYDKATLLLKMKEMYGTLRIVAGVDLFPTFRDTGSMCEQLNYVYIDIAQKTFDYRAKHYLSSLQANGFFDYGAFRFYFNGDVVNPKNKKKLFNLYSDKLKTTDNPFELVLKRKSASIAEFIRYIFEPHVINLTFDRDVFLAIFHSVYSLDINTIRR